MKSGNKIFSWWVKPLLIHFYYFIITDGCLWSGRTWRNFGFLITQEILHAITFSNFILSVTLTIMNELCPTVHTKRDSKSNNQFCTTPSCSSSLRIFKCYILWFRTWSTFSCLYIFTKKSIHLNLPIHERSNSFMVILSWRSSQVNWRHINGIDPNLCRQCGHTCGDVNARHTNCSDPIPCAWNLK